MYTMPPGPESDSTLFGLLTSLIVMYIILITNLHYSTIMSFHQIKSKERAKYKTVIHCYVLV